MDNYIIENYLNKKVAVYEKQFSRASSYKSSVARSEGILTKVIPGEFIELDNKKIIFIRYVYEIEIID